MHLIFQGTGSSFNILKTLIELASMDILVGIVAEYHREIKDLIVIAVILAPVAGAVSGALLALYSHFFAESFHMCNKMIINMSDSTCHPCLQSWKTICR